jgi:hypothetical protein
LDSTQRGARRLALRWATIACPVGAVYLWQSSAPIDTKFRADKAEAVNVPLQCLGWVSQGWSDYESDPFFELSNGQALALQMALYVLGNLPQRKVIL